MEAFRRLASSDNIPSKPPSQLCLSSSSPSLSGIGDGREETSNGRTEMSLKMMMMMKKRLRPFMVKVVLKLRENQPGGMGGGSELADLSLDSMLKERAFR